jgi:hypothetical protein
VSPLTIKTPSKNMREKQTNTPIIFALLHLLVFQAYINQIHGSRSKIPSKKTRQAALRGGI